MQIIPSRTASSPRSAARALVALVLGALLAAGLAVPTASASVAGTHGAAALSATADTHTSATTAAKKKAKKKAKKALAPKTVKVLQTGYGKFRLKWSKGKRAKGYRVIVARDKQMKQVVHRTPYSVKRTRWVGGGKIEEGARYFFQVRSFAKKGTPGKKSKVKAVRTETRKPKKPMDISVKGRSTTSALVRWKPARQATGYTVKVRPTKYGTPVWQRRVAGADASSMLVEGIDRLGLGHTFFVTVTADRLEQKFRDSDTIIGATAAPYTQGKTILSNLKVGSYNVLTPSSAADWKSRRDGLVKLVKDRDILGVQELPSRNDWPRDLAQRSGLLHPADVQRDCGSASVHILFSSDFTLTECGLEILAPGASRAKTTDKGQRRAVWAVLRHRSGPSVLVVNTHLSNGRTAADERLRVTQAKDLRRIVEQLNATRGLPLIVMGDLNSFYGHMEHQPLDVLEDWGLLGTDLFADKVINGQYGSTNTGGTTSTRGFRLDHIFTSRDVHIAEFEVRYKAKSPSDHHPVVATLNLRG